MRRHLILSAVALFAAVFSTNAQTSIPVTKDAGGRYMVSATVNGVGVRTYYTEENWFASMSTTTYMFLYENGYIQDSEVRGMTVLKMPNGSSTKAASFVIKNLRLGNVIVKDLPAFVVTKQDVPLLIGSSTFDCFGDVSIVGDRLYINDADEIFESDPEVAAPLVSRLDSLKIAAQSHLDAKRYKDAESCLSAIDREGELTMYNKYQYAVVLNILGKSNETIAVTNEWLSENAGKSLTLDYWMYDCLGDSYARLNQHAKAIEYYELAVQTYYAMFDTNENEVRKSFAKDETLGITLYDLGRQYAFTNNLKKAKSCCSLAAKCGNEPAKQFCDQYNVKY